MWVAKKVRLQPAARGPSVKEAFVEKLASMTLYTSAVSSGIPA